jgi:hypothetical protein
MSEFYIGYLSSAPLAIRRRVRLLAAAMVVFAVGGAALFAASQNRFAASFFDYGKPAEFSGSLVLQPYPALLVNRGMAGSSETPYLLVAPGKFGADALVSGREGRNVRLRGTLIHRTEGKMIEIEPSSIQDLGESADRKGRPRDLGFATLSGEIVDTKCFLGVMNPGEGKVHRDCAARCLSGGIPPALVSSDFDGLQRLFLLVGDDGKPLLKSGFLQRAGRPVAISGRIFESQGLYYLSTNEVRIQALE